jgi:hypothetical protein
MHHAHGWPNDCPHLAPAAQSQQAAWNRGRNGLVSNGLITGPGPKGKDTPSWTKGISLMEDYLMAFADEVAAKAAKAVLTTDGIIPNTVTGNKSNKYVSLATAVAEIGHNTEYTASRSITTDGLVANEYNPADANNTIAATTALALLLRRQREQGDQLDALTKAVAALQKGPQS